MLHNILDLETAIKFLEEEATALADNVDASFIVRIAIAEKKLNLGLHHDSLAILKEV